MLDKRRREVTNVSPLQKRKLPGICIIDAGLNVLYHRAPDAHIERRDSFRFNGSGLPSGFLPRARDFWQRPHNGHTETHFLADGSLLVRFSWLHGEAGQAACLIYERVNWRNHVTSATEKFRLSKREAHVLSLLVDGLSTNEIAQKLHISRSTALFHIGNLLAKTGARNRTQMISRTIA